MADTQTNPIPGNSVPQIPKPGQPGLLGDFGNMGNAPASVSSATTAVTQQMRQLPIADMIKSIAVGISSAQSELNKNAIAEFQELANTNVTIAGQSYNMLQLGFAPHFYFFQKVTIEVSFELKFHYEQEQTTKLGLSANLTVSGEASRTTTTSDAAVATNRKKAADKQAADATKAREDAQKALDAATVAKNGAPGKVTAAKDALDQALNGKTLAALKTASDEAQSKVNAEEAKKKQNQPFDAQAIIDNKAIVDAHTNAQNLDKAHKDALQDQTQAETNFKAAEKKLENAKAAEAKAKSDAAAEEKLTTSELTKPKEEETPETQQTQTQQTQGN